MRTGSDTAFVACIEPGILETQAFLLFESIRRYAGVFRDRPIYAVSPRAGHALTNAAARRLEALEVDYIDLALNTECTEYGSANRVAAAAHIERTRRHEVLVVLDSDTIFLREPSELSLGGGVDVAMRPVDLKEMSTAAPDDPFDSYWRELCACCGVAYDAIPWTTSFVDGVRVKANYNGGLVVARTRLGVLQRWSDFFLRSIRAGLRPHGQRPSFRTGVGWVEPAAGRLWGSNQAALALAAWDATRAVIELSPRYNYPLHLHEQLCANGRAAVFTELVHVHYHWLLEADALPANPLFGASSPLADEQRAWLGARTPLRSSDDGPGAISPPR